MIKTLAQYVDNLQRNSEYVFSVDQAKGALQISQSTLKVALHRLTLKNRIARLRAGFYVIVPIEYQNKGTPPPTWYIDTLMQQQRYPYYVCLLTAAAFHGSAHQQPQTFQVMTTAALRAMSVANSCTKFIIKKHINNKMFITVNTPTGTMAISTPEMTAYDLLTYPSAAGHLNNIATVLIELTDLLDAEKLVEWASLGIKLPIIQRLGYLLDKYCHTDISELLYAWIKKQNTRFVPLKTNWTTEGAVKNHKWHILISENIEVDI